MKVTHDAGTNLFRVEAPPGVEIVEGNWFAWSPFHPESSVYTADDTKR